MNDQLYTLLDVTRLPIGGWAKFLRTTGVLEYLLKETFQQLWDYNSPAWVGKFLFEWCRLMMRSRIEPMKKIARSLRQHRELILNYFRAGKLISIGAVEGLNKRPK